MYLGELLQYFQSSNNLPQSAQTLDFDLKSCFVLLNTSSRSTRCSVVSSGYLNCFRTGSCKFLSPSSADRISFCSCFIHQSFLSIRPFSHHFEFGFCLAALTKVHFCYCFPQTFTQYPAFARRRKKDGR